MQACDGGSGAPLAPTGGGGGAQEMTFRLRPKRRSLKEEKLVTKPGDGGIIPGIGSGFCRGLEVGKRRRGQVRKEVGVGWGRVGRAGGGWSLLGALGDAGEPAFFPKGNGRQ